VTSRTWPNTGARSSTAERLGRGRSASGTVQAGRVEAARFAALSEGVGVGVGVGEGGIDGEASTGGAGAGARSAPPGGIGIGMTPIRASSGETARARMRGRHAECQVTHIQ